jgi:hypothetical protein
MQLPILTRFLRAWHRTLGLRHQLSRAWHCARLREELHERRTATTRLARLSETSDVLFTISRAHHDSCAPFPKLPPFVVSRHGAAYAYMIVRFTLRWGFYRVAAGLCCGRKGWHEVREVVNPAKDSKLDVVAPRHGIDAVQFRRVARRLRWVWPLLP